MIRSRNRARGFSGGGSTPAFLPSDIAGLQLWLDASDTASITHVAGLVSQWSDKSGNGRHMVQGTATRQPLYVPASNLITFSTAVSADVLTNKGIINTQNLTIIVIGSTASSVNFGNTFVAQDGEADNGWQFRGHSGRPQFVVHGTLAANNGDYSDAATFGTEYIFANRYDSTAGTRRGWRDGISKLNYNSDTGTIPYSANDLSVGGNSGGGVGNLNGNIKGILVYNVALTDADINQIGNWAATHHGVTSWTNI